MFVEPGRGRGAALARVVAPLYVVRVKAHAGRTRRLDAAQGLHGGDERDVYKGFKEVPSYHNIFQTNTSPCSPPPSPTCAISNGAPIVFFRSTSDVVSERAVAVNSGLAFTVLRTELRSVCSAEAVSVMPVGGSAALQARSPGFGAVDHAQAAEAELLLVAPRLRPAEEEGPRVAAIAEAVAVPRL